MSSFTLRRPAARRTILAGLAIITAASAAFVGAFAKPAAANASSVVLAIQGGSCNAFSGAYQLPGSAGVVPAAFSTGSLVVPACGPLPGTSGGPSVHPYPGSLATPGYQCVEFSERYLYYRFGVTMGTPTNGDQVVGHYAAKYPSLFTRIPNGTTGHAPVKGDVLSFSTSSTFSSASGGHTAVVQSSSVNSSGNGSVTVVEENAVSSGVQVLTVSGWTVTFPGFPYIDWLHPAASPATVIVPRPATLYNPATGLEEAYYRGGNGDLWETYFANGAEHTQDLNVAMSAN